VFARTYFDTFILTWKRRFVKGVLKNKPVFFIIEAFRPDLSARILEKRSQLISRFSRGKRRKIRKFLSKIRENGIEYERGAGAQCGKRFALSACSADRAAAMQRREAGGTPRGGDRRDHHVKDIVL